MITDKPTANSDSGGSNEGATFSSALGRQPELEDVRAKLAEIGFEGVDIVLLEDGQVWQITMLPGSAPGWDRRLQVMHLVSQALEALAPGHAPDDISVNVAGEQIKVGVLWPGTRNGKIIVGHHQTLVNWAY